jgi:hypothetical protein
MRGRRRTFQLMVSACLLHRATCCGWGWRLDKNGEVLADTVVEIMSGGMVIGRALAKSSAYGECPPAERSATTLVLRKSVLRLHSGYDAVDDLLPADACSAIEPVPGGALWVLRGGCNFINKTTAAKQAGAAALLIGNAGKRKRSDTELVAIRQV